MNPDTNPMFAKFDQALGVQTPTTNQPQVTSRADQIRNIAKQTQAPQPLPGGIPGLHNINGINAVKTAGTSLAKTASDTLQQGRDIAERQMTGKQGLGDTALQTLGLGANAAGKAVFGTAFDVLKSILPSDVKNTLKSGISAVGGAIKPTIDAVTQSKVGQALADHFQKNPNEAQDAKAMFDILSTFYGGGAAEKGATLAKPLVEEGAAGVKNLAEQGVSAVKGATDSIGNKVGQVADNLLATPTAKPVESALKEIPAKQFDEYADVAKKAATSNKEITPMELAGKKAQSALDTIDRKLSTIGEQKNAVISQAAVGNKPVGNIVTKFKQDLLNAIKDKIPVAGDKKAYQEILDQATKLGNNPPAKQVDKFIDFVQDKIYTAKRDLTVPVTDNVEQTLRPLTGKLNEALKSQLPESYRNLNKAFSDMVGIRNELNTKLGAEGEKGGSLMKRVFSPSDAGTKELFKQVKDLTGVDLVNEATLAKFMMETMGDARQKSLLESLKLPSSVSSSGFLHAAKDMITSKFNTPEDILRRAREMTIQ